MSTQKLKSAHDSSIEHPYLLQVPWNFCVPPPWVSKNPWFHLQNLSDFIDIHYSALNRSPQWPFLLWIPQLLKLPLQIPIALQWLSLSFTDLQWLPLTSDDSCPWTSKEFSLTSNEFIISAHPQRPLLTIFELLEMKLITTESMVTSPNPSIKETSPLIIHFDFRHLNLGQ